MNNLIIFGALGAAILVIAWAVETIENIRKRKLIIHPHFAVLYVIGNLLLTYYSYVAQSPVFFWLGIALILAIICELIYSLKFWL